MSAQSAEPGASGVRQSPAGLRVLSVAGIGGVGKTTLACALAARLRWTRVSIDDCSIARYGSVAAVNSAADRSARYDVVYGLAHDAILDLLGDSRSVIAEGSYTRAIRRLDLLGRCAGLGVESGIILLDDEHGARARNRLREGDARLPESELDAEHALRARRACREIEDEPWAMSLVCRWIDGAGWRILGADRWQLVPLLRALLPAR